MSLECTLIEHASPTLAGLKPASLFRYMPKERRRFGLEFKQWRERLAGFGLRLVILRGCPQGGGYLLYLYRENALRNALERPENRVFLRQQGYTDGASNRDYLRQLALRLCVSEKFPSSVP